MLETHALRTDTEGFTNITETVRRAVLKSGAWDGLAAAYRPHATAGVTANENADPDVARDFLPGLSRALPDRPEFRHAEGNPAAHLKAGYAGASVTIPVRCGRLLPGTWQAVNFYGFDGPRTRTFYVKVPEG